jgi:hypothetical protein
MKSPATKLFVSITVVTVLTMFNISANGQIFLGPTDSGPSSGGANWLSGAYGTATVSIDSSDPAANGSYDLTISNTVAGADNKADWRSQPFSLGPAAGGARPVTFSFAYKLADTVAKGNNILVQLRFFDSTGTGFIDQKVVPVGARTGDSTMTSYKTITVRSIIVPRKAQTADVWINAGSFEPWISGTAQFANISVTTESRSWLFKIGITAAILIGICILAALVIYLVRKRSPNTALEPTPTAP